MSLSLGGHDSISTQLVAHQRDCLQGLRSFFCTVVVEGATVLLAQTMCNLL